MNSKSNRLSFGYQLISLLAKLPRVPGRDRVLHWLSAFCGVCTDVDLRANGRFVIRVPNIKEPVALSLLFDGEYEPLTLEVMRKNLSEGNVFADVGANIGCFTLPASLLVGETGKVLAIEASDFVFPYLEHNIKQNHLSNISLHNCAAGRSVGDATFYDAPTDKFGMGSKAAWPGHKGYSVRARTIDEIVKAECIDAHRITFMKIDVEGFELEVLQGADELLASRNLCILFEFIDWAESRAGFAPGAAQSYLMSRGFTLYSQDEYLRSGKPLSTPIETGAEMIVALRH